MHPEEAFSILLACMMMVDHELRFSRGSPHPESAPANCGSFSWGFRRLGWITL